MRYFVGDEEFKYEEFEEALDCSKRTKQPLIDQDGVVLMEHKEFPQQIVNEIKVAYELLHSVN